METVKSKKCKSVRESLLPVSSDEKTAVKKTALDAVKNSVCSGYPDYAENIDEVVLISNPDNVEARDLYFFR